MKRRFPLAAAAVAIAFTAVAGIAVRGILINDAYRARLREVYDGAVLSALTQMEDVELSLRKALLSGDREAENRYLSRAGAGAAQVRRALSLLPLSHAATQGAVKLANQAEDYARALLDRETTQEDAARLTALAAACRRYIAALAASRDALSARAAAGTDAFYAAPDAPAYDSDVSYPALIYDGPFSDAVRPAPAKGLGQRTVSRAEAAEIARDFVGADRALEITEGWDMGGEIPCWGVSVRTRDGMIRAAVTKTGGRILWMAPDSADFPAEKSLEECRDSALAFLSSRGFAEMRPTYFEAYDGLMVISFAAVQGDVLLYPDQVKLQMRRDTAQAVGLEARSYWQNHAPRALPAPALTEQEAGERVSPLLEKGEGQLCLIPTDGGEKLCWEFRCAYGGDTYLSYINALDGKQEDLLQLVETDTGLNTV